MIGFIKNINLNFLNFILFEICPLDLGGLLPFLIKLEFEKKFT